MVDFVVLIYFVVYIYIIYNFSKEGGFWVLEFMIGENIKKISKAFPL